MLQKACDFAVAATRWQQRENQGAGFARLAAHSAARSVGYPVMMDRLYLLVLLQSSCLG